MNWEFVRRNLERAIAERDVSHNDIARSSGVPQATISRFLAGENEAMHLDTLWAICKALDLTVAEVIGERPIEIDARARRILRAMEHLPDYKKDIVVSTAETLAKSDSKKTA